MTYLIILSEYKPAFAIVDNITDEYAALVIGTALRMLPDIKFQIYIQLTRVLNSLQHVVAK